MSDLILIVHTEFSTCKGPLNMTCSFISRAFCLCRPLVSHLVSHPFYECELSQPAAEASRSLKLWIYISIRVLIFSPTAGAFSFIGSLFGCQTGDDIQQVEARRNGKQNACRDGLEASRHASALKAWIGRSC